MRTKKDKPTAPPLADTLRAALASDWHSLAALDTLTAARGSDARRLVHEALRALRGEGCVLEERVGRGGVEVRLGPALPPIHSAAADGQPGDLSPEDIEAIRNALLEAEDDDSDGAAYCDEIAPLSPAAAARMADLIEHPSAPSEALRALCLSDDEPDDYTRFHAALAVGVAAFDTLPICGGATCPDCEHAITQLEDHALTCANGRRDAPWWDAKRAAYGAEIEAHVKASTPSGASAQERAVAFAGEAIRRRREGLYKAPTLDAPTPPVGQAAPVEAASRPVNALSAHLAAMGHVEEAREVEWLPPAAPPKEPGPSSRCAVCDRPYARHADAAGVPYAGPEGHPFTPKPRGRPPATPSKQPPIPNAAPAILPRARQRRTPGPVVDVDGGRVERATPSEQAAILAGMAEKWDAAVAEHRAEREGEPEPKTSRAEEDRRPGLDISLPSTPTTPERYRFWSPSLGLGWLTWGDVCPSTPTRFEPDAGAAIEWIWTQCGVGRPGQREPKREGPVAVEWRAWEYFKTTSGETLVFRRGGAPPGTTATTLTEGQRAETLAAIERVSVTPPRAAQPCRPPLCHADDIHDPSRVRGFVRALCEAHRRWVEGAGGSVRYEPKEETV